MTRLFLATALVLQLSGVAAVAAFVSVQPEGMTREACCCHHERSDTPVAVPVCPCAMAPDRDAPVSDAPVVASTAPAPVSMPAIVSDVLPLAAPDLRVSRVTDIVAADTGPPPLSASHLRC